MLCGASWPAYYGESIMTHPSDGPARPPDSPALQRAESALDEAATAVGRSPAEQAPLLAAAQARLAELLVEGATPDAADAPTQN